MSISAADVKSLRERTGAGIMDAKAALGEADGDVEKAIEILRVRGQASAAKRSGRTTSEGTVGSYVHATGKVGVMVEVQCETDFVARNDEFQEFAREVAIHIAGSPNVPQYVSAEEIPEAAKEAERKVYAARAAEEGKPEDIIQKIVEGQISKWSKDVALLEQEHIRSDMHEGKTIEQLRQELAANTGENIRIARFARFQVGEERRRLSRPARSATSPPGSSPFPQRSSPAPSRSRNRAGRLAREPSTSLRVRAVGADLGIGAALFAVDDHALAARSMRPSPRASQRTAARVIQRQPPPDACGKHEVVDVGHVAGLDDGERTRTAACPRARR